MKIDVQNIKDALYVEFLAYEKNTVKMNNLYKKNKEEAYSKMKNSELNEFKFIKQATIRKKNEYKKAIGLLEIYKQYEKDTSAINLDDHNKLPKDIRNKLDYMYDIISIIIDAHPCLETALMSENYEKIRFDIIKNVEKMDFNLSMIVMGILLIKNEREYLNVFGEENHRNIKEYLVRMIEKVEIDFKSLSKEDQEKFALARSKYFPNKRFSDLFSLHKKIKEIISSKYKDKIDLKDFDSLVITLQSVLEIVDIDIDTIEIEHNITKDDINKVFTLLTMYNIRDDYKPIYVYLSMMLLFLGKEIRNNKQLFFNNNDEIFELEKKVRKKESEMQNEKIKALEKIINEKDDQIKKLKREYRVGLERDIIEKEKEIIDLESVIEAFEEALNEPETKVKNEDTEILKEEVIDYTKQRNEKEIYVIGGYSKLINKLKVNFPNLVWMDKNYFKVSNFDVFILSSYMSHADKYKIDSLGLEYSYISGSGYKEIVTEIFEIIKSLDN